MKKLISFLAILALLFNMIIFTGCTDDDPDLPSDDNGGIDEPPTNNEEGDYDTDPKSLKLVENGTALFNVVCSSDLGSEAMKTIVNWINVLAQRGLEVKRVMDYRPEHKQDTEILIGSSFSGREEYSVDPHGYGEKGFFIKETNGKVVIFGGSEEAAIEAINLFFETHFSLEEGQTKINDVSLISNYSILRPQEDYKISSVSLLGKELSGSIYAPANVLLAQKLQSSLYSNTGIWMPISAELDENVKITISSVSSCGEDGFAVKVNTDGIITIECAYANKFEEAVKSFIKDTFEDREGAVEFDADYEYTKRVSVVRYDEFGAIGDGETDDFNSIKAAHDFANQCGQRVEANSGMIYYIGHNKDTILVKTDVDWKDARFIIDDSEIPTTERGFWVFKAVSDYSARNVAIPEGFTLEKGQENIGITFDEPKLLRLLCETEFVYLRYGANSNTGYAKQEMILVDENGNVDPSTPIIWDYASMSSITAYCITDTPITIQGGIFTTIANRQTSASKYYARGIRIERSNTRVYNVKHYLSGEPTTTDGSCPYTGFFSGESANNVVFEKCVLTAHKTYVTLQPDGDRVNQGNYDTQTYRCTNIKWVDCTQSNSIDTYPGTWGVMASNFCKNLGFEGCVLSRFDAHMGVHNVKLVNSTVGEVINLVGSGEAIFENVKLSSGQNNYFIRLREDYGSTWEGMIKIKNGTLVIRDNWNSAFVIRADWIEHWFGYYCYLPNIEIDGFTFVRKNGSAYDGKVYLFKQIAANYNEDNGDLRKNSINPLYVPKYITIKNFPYTIDYIQGTNNDIILDSTIIKKED